MFSDSSVDVPGRSRARLGDRRAANVDPESRKYWSHSTRLLASSSRPLGADRLGQHRVRLEVVQRLPERGRRCGRRCRRPRSRRRSAAAGPPSPWRTPSRAACSTAATARCTFARPVADPALHPRIAGPGVRHPVGHVRWAYPPVRPAAGQRAGLQPAVGVHRRRGQPGQRLMVSTQPGQRTLRQRRKEVRRRWTMVAKALRPSASTERDVDVHAVAGQFRTACP